MLADMNIYISNNHNTYNYGSMMMGESFIYHFNKLSKSENNYFVETRDDYNIKRLIQATGVNNISSVPMNALFKENIKKTDYILGFLGLKKIVSGLIKNVDLFVVLGGDDFTEDYGWKGPIIRAVKFNLLKREGLKVVMLGQTMGPYHSFRKPIMKNLLSKIDKIYTRDPITYNYLKKLGLNNIDIMDDLALLPLSKQEPKERTQEYITYCPSELIYRYSKSGKREDWIDFNLFMIDTIIKKYPDKKLVLLAHVLKPERADDRIIVNELYNAVKDKYKENIILENNEMYPYQVRKYIQKSLLVISSRMHPVISSIQCEIPAIAISYSRKYWGIIGERYGLGDYIIDIRYLSYSEMKEKFIAVMNNIETNYQQIEQKMRDKNRLANQSIIKALNEINNFANQIN